MPLSPERYLQTQSDGYVQVRSPDHKLLGCISASLPTDDFMQTAIGQMEVRSALIFCLVPSGDKSVSWSMSTLTDPTRPLLFLDTETTGKDPSHSHLVSLSFQLDHDGKLYCAGDFVIRPEGFEIPTSSTE